MRIGNPNSLLASRNLGKTSKAISRALERLSTGKRVNSARDGVADYSASLSLDSQIRGINQINLGLNRALGMVQVADSAISTQLDIVQRMREIAVEGANGTLDTSTRKTLQSELQSLIEEFDRITKSTEFDGRALLDGAMGASSLMLDETGSSLSVETPDLNLTEAFEKTIGTAEFNLALSLDPDTDQLAVADVNNDGFEDIIGVENSASAITVNLGNGDGSFKSEETYATGDNSDEIEIADFNGDGIMDVAALDLGNASSPLSILYGNGDGSFKAVETLDLTGVTGQSLSVGDIDNDGNEDLMIATTAGVEIYFGNGDGSFKSLYSSASAVNVSGTLADVNNDGILDHVGNYDFALGNGDGSFGAKTNFDLSGDAMVGFSVADVNGDGNLDVAHANFDNGSIDINLGNGDGTFGAYSQAALTSTDTMDIEVGDFNNDGVVDFIVGIDGGATTDLVLGKGDGTFEAAVNYGAGNHLAVGDFNADGAQDFLGGTGLVINLFENRTKSASAVSDVNVLMAEDATELIDILDTTVSKLTAARADLGTLYSRIETAQAANLLQQESLSSAKSLIVDADFAIETAELVKNQVLQQAQVAVQAQANVQLQVVLGLLQV